MMKKKRNSTSVHWGLVLSDAFSSSVLFAMEEIKHNLFFNKRQEINLLLIYQVLLAHQSYDHLLDLSKVKGTTSAIIC